MTTVESALGRSRRESPTFIWAATLVLGVLVATFAEWGPDWPAQDFRAGLAIHNGLLAWSNQWYAGEPLPGYSLLYPVFARVFGAAGTGVVASTAAAWSAGRLLPMANRAAHWRYSAAVAVMLATNLLIGQIPFLLGTAAGLGALLALDRGRGAVSAGLALLCSLASPLAGAFLILVLPAFAAKYGWRRSSLLGTALIGIGFAAIVGGAGGPFPCPWLSMVSVLVFSVIAFFAAGNNRPVLRRFAWMYGLAGLLAFFVPNPIGGNVTRLGKLIALPLACYLLTFKYRREILKAVAVLAVALLWPLVPAVQAIQHGATDPSRNASYYTGLLTFLKTQSTADGRMEIPFTREHWEAAYVASAFPLARGWERQTDLQYDAVLYSPLTAAGYEQWLVDNAVGLVALPNVPLDAGGKAEAALLAAPPSYLRPVYSDANWKVWQVVAPHPLVSGATITSMGPASFTLNFAAPGTALVKIRSSRLWQVSTATACVSSDPTGWLQVVSTAPGPVTVRARLNLQLVTGLPDCHPN